MTEKRVDTYLALRAFEQLRRQGQLIEGEYHYEGFIASTDFDGYTVFIRSGEVSLTIYFHNKYDVKFSNAEQLDKFLKRLYAIGSE